MTYDEGKCPSLSCFGGVHTLYCTAPRLSSTGMNYPSHYNCRWREFPVFFMKRRRNDDAQIGNSKIQFYLFVSHAFFSLVLIPLNTSKKLQTAMNIKNIQSGSGEVGRSARSLKMTIRQNFECLFRKVDFCEPDW
jgi:hypothetical protein